MFIATNSQNDQKCPTEILPHILLCNVQSDAEWHVHTQSSTDGILCLSALIIHAVIHLLVFTPFFHYHPSASWETLSHYYPTTPIKI